MNKPKARMTPDQLFAEAVSQEGPSLSTSEFSLLVSGLKALRAANEKSLNKIELCAVSNMIAYAAYTQGVDEATIMAVLAAHFGVEDVKAIPSRRYDEVMSFLLYLKMAEVIN